MREGVKLAKDVNFFGHFLLFLIATQKKALTDLGLKTSYRLLKRCRPKKGREFAKKH